jgi:hypothetical protein
MDPKATHEICDVVWRRGSRSFSSNGVDAMGTRLGCSFLGKARQQRFGGSVCGRPAIAYPFRRGWIRISAGRLPFPA